MKNKGVPEINDDLAKKLMKAMEEVNKQVNKERQERKEEKNKLLNEIIENKEEMVTFKEFTEKAEKIIPQKMFKK